MKSVTDLERLKRLYTLETTPEVAHRLLEAAVRTEDGALFLQVLGDATRSLNEAVAWQGVRVRAWCYLRALDRKALLVREDDVEREDV